jgi:quinol monooxygenase YgiN
MLPTTVELLRDILREAEFLEAQARKTTQEAFLGDEVLKQYTTIQMVGGLKIVQVKAEHVAEFERLFAELRAEMQKHEPGCLLYSLLKSRTKPGAYIVHEQYRNQAALEAHQKSGHGAKYFPQMRAIIEKIDVEYFDGVVD